MVGGEGFRAVRALQEEGLRVVLVGGSCVELYTGGEYRTGDIDLVVPSDEREEVREKLEEMGFETQSPVGKVWVRDRTVIEIVGRSYQGRVRSGVDLEDYGMGSGKLDNVESPEDILLDRISACKFWNSPSDCEQAYWLLAGMREELDWDYLERRAEELEVSDFLDEGRLLEEAGE